MAIPLELLEAFNHSLLPVIEGVAGVHAEGPLRDRQAGGRCRRNGSLTMLSMMQKVIPSVSMMILIVALKGAFHDSGARVPTAMAEFSNCVLSSKFLLYPDLHRTKPGQLGVRERIMDRNLL